MDDGTTTNALVDRLEAELRVLSAQLIDPQEGECLVCFVARALGELGCDTTLRWAQRFRHLRSPKATGLERRLGYVGGFCDCEIFLNGYVLTRALCERDLDTDELRAPERLPICAGVRRTSTQPCANWERRTRRPRW